MMPPPKTPKRTSGLFAPVTPDSQQQRTPNDGKDPLLQKKVPVTGTDATEPSNTEGLKRK
jgi:hypothetical protein